MNKDKAIQLLERLQDPEPYEPMLTKDAYDAIQMAIDALSADGDTISKKAAIEALDEIESEIAEGLGFEYEKWQKYFCDLPPVQTEQLGTNLAEVGTDCISRQALLDKFESWLKTKDYNDGELNMLKAVLYEIRFMRPAQPEPSQVAKDIARIVENGQDMRVIAQPERIKGHWICDRSWSEGVGMGESYGHYWKCDKCGHLEQGDWGECGCNFCSNCGSDNREEIKK